MTNCDERNNVQFEVWEMWWRMLSGGGKWLLLGMGGGYGQVLRIQGQTFNVYWVNVANREMKFLFPRYKIRSPPPVIKNLEFKI